MEVAAGPTVGLTEHVNIPAFLHGGEKNDKRVEELVAAAGRRSNGFCFIQEEEEEEEVVVVVKEEEEAAASSETSSIGAQSSSEDDGRGGEEDEVQSKPKDGPLGSLDSLEESLPIKRGLSNFFTGKSKSFASLSAVSGASVGDLAKPENAFNKRRRILMACKNSWSRRASYSSLLPPLTTVDGDDDDDEDEETEDMPPLLPRRHGKNAGKAFRSPRSFSLSDLQHA